MFTLTSTREQTGLPLLGPCRGQARRPHITTPWCLDWAEAHIRYLDFFCRLSVTDAKIDLSSLSERAKQVIVSLVMSQARETPRCWTCSYCVGIRDCTLPGTLNSSLGWVPAPVSQGQLSVCSQELPVIQDLIFARHFHVLSHVSLRSRGGNRLRVACQGHKAGQRRSQGRGSMGLPPEWSRQESPGVV